MQLQIDPREASKPLIAEKSWMLHLLTRWMKTGLVREREGSVVKRWSRPSGAEMAVLASLLVPPSLLPGETGAVCAAEGAHQVRTVHTQLAALNRHGERAAGPG